MTELEQRVLHGPLSDTHEHLRPEGTYPADILVDLFDHYVAEDLVSAGASSEAVQRLLHGPGEIGSRFEDVARAWDACQWTGYGEATRRIAREKYGLSKLDPNSLEEAADRIRSYQRPGYRLRLLRDEAKLDHVQIDDFDWACRVDESGPDFFRFDLSAMALCCGTVDLDALGAEVQGEIATANDLRTALELLFEKHAPNAVAIKSQHAYHRTLRWHERSDEEADAVVQRLRSAKDVAPEEREALGDWCMSEVCRLAQNYSLPFKIHTGYYAGNGPMPLDRIKASNLHDLVVKYAGTQFVLMHIAYPYASELLALAKHFPNVNVDLCWAWSIDSHETAEFVRRWLHTAPINKLLAFGGDSWWPHAAWAYSVQAREGLLKALQGEDLAEGEALDIAERLMIGNANALFRT